MLVCHKNLYHTQKLQKRAYNKSTKPQSSASGDKIWLNCKYLKIKQNRKLKAQFFGFFRVLHLVSKQAYKLKLSKKWKIYDVFHILLLEQDKTRKTQIDKNATQLEFKPNDNEKYKVKGIRDNAVYVKILKADYLLKIYYLVS